MISHPSANSSKPILSLKGIRKSFGQTEVLKGIEFNLLPGQIVGLVGANGAGKSTLMKIVSGNQTDFEGELLWKGEPRSFDSPEDAIEAGIYMIPQELGLVKDLSAVDNILLGREVSRYGFLSSKDSRKIAAEALKKVGAKVELDIPVAALSSGTQQQVAIARSLLSNAELLILDEPTSMLTNAEAERLFELVLEAKARGTAVIYITHRFSELFRLADRVVAFRDGVVSGEGKISEVDEDQLVRWMVGNAFEKAHKRAEKFEKDFHISRPVLKVRNLSNAVLKNVSFDLYRSEILGLIGLMGSGRSEIMRAIAGADSVTEGEIFVDNIEVRTGSVPEAIRAGIVMSPEDRRTQGLFLDQTVGFNAFIQNSEKFSSSGVVRFWSEKNAFRRLKAEMPMPIDRDWQMASTLSGGNQQKLILGKILLKGGKVILLDEVTTGVDVMTKSQILEKIVSLGHERKSVLFTSSDWEEVTEIADRVLLIKDGRVEGELKRSEFDNEKIMSILVQSKKFDRKVVNQ